MMEEAKKRDHRVLGKKLDLFSIQEVMKALLCFAYSVGPSVHMFCFCFWSSRAAVVPVYPIAGTYVQPPISFI